MPSDSEIAEDMSSLLAQLEPQETNSQFGSQVVIQRQIRLKSPSGRDDLAPCDDLCAAWRHRGWAVRRWKVFEALKRTEQSNSRRSAFAQCGGDSWVQYSPSRNCFRIAANTCRDRFCVPCQQVRGLKLRARLKTLLQSRDVRFVTLTMRHSHAPLVDQLQRLYSCFALLRRRDVWADAVTGGAAVLEVKLSKSGLWHPHLHCLVHGNWIDARKLSAAWLAVTGDSSIVDVRAIKADVGLGYVTKYLAKPADSSVWLVPDKLDELIVAMKGRRAVITFGECQGVDVEEELDPQPNDWVPYESLRSILEKASRGEAQAFWVITNISHRRENSCGPSPPDKQN